MPSLRSSLVALLVMAPLLSAQTEAPKSACSILPHHIVEKRLANGLEVIVVVTPFANSVTMEIPIQAGPRVELGEKDGGLAHLFEHLTYSGTTKVSAAEYEDRLARVSAHSNASTGNDFTTYELTFAKEDLESMLQLEADRLQNLPLTQGSFDIAAHAIQDEAKRAALNPMTKLSDTERAASFSVHPYRHSAFGSAGDVTDLPKRFAEAKSFYDRWYRPEFTTIVLAGDLDAERTMALVETYWGSWKRGDLVASIERPVEPEAKDPLYAHATWNTPIPPWISIGFRSPAFSASDKDFAALQMLLRYCFGPDSSLNQRLAEEDEIVDYLDVDIGANADPSLLTITARVKNANDVLLVRNEILSTIGAVRGAELSSEQLERAKSNERFAFLQSLTNSEAIADAVTRYARFQRSAATLNDFFCLQQNLTAADLRQAARRYLTESGLVVTTLSNEAMPRAIERPPTIREMVAEASPTPLPGGDVSVIVRKSTNPLLELRFVFSTGSALDPPYKDGLAQLAATMITSGSSKQMTSSEVRQALFPIAASFKAQVDREMTTLTATIHRDNWERLLDVIIPMIVEPSLRLDDYKEAKKNQLKGYAALTYNDEELARELLQERASQGFGYRHPSIGTLDGLDAIARKDVADFIRKNYTTGNLTVGVSGDVPDAMVTRLKSELRKLPGGKSPLPFAGKRPPLGISIDIFSIDSGKTTIALGSPLDVTRKDPDFAALSVARSWLGEHASPTGRLFQRISRARGFNEGAFAYIEGFPQAATQLFPDPNRARQRQIFEMVIRPLARGDAHMALRVAVHELREMIAKGLTEDQFRVTRDYLLRNFDLAMSDPGRALGSAIDARWYGSGDAELLKKQLENLTRDDVNRAIRKYLSGSNLFVVMISPDAKNLRGALITDRPSIPTYSDGKRTAALRDEDAVIGELKLEIGAEDVRIFDISEVFSDQ